MNIRHTPRLFVNTVLGKGQKLTMADSRAHYLQNVLRMKVNDALRLFNGMDGEWLGQITGLAKRSVEIVLQSQTRPQKATPDLWLCCASIKKTHFDYMIEKATELGVSEIRPLLTARTQIRDVNVERCITIATEAAEQSERLSIPVIREAVTLEKFIASWPPGRRMIVCAEWGAATPVQDAIHSLNPTPSEAAIVTGPEGGFAAEELEKLKTIPNSLFIRLGPRILRADTAAIAALSCWQALRGDWTMA